MVIGNTWSGKGESQNHLMVEDGSDLWRSSNPTILFKEGSPRHLAYSCVQTRQVLNNSWKGGAITLLGNLFHIAVWIYLSDPVKKKERKKTPKPKPTIRTLACLMLEFQIEQRSDALQIWDLKTFKNETNLDFIMDNCRLILCQLLISHYCH